MMTLEQIRQRNKAENAAAQRLQAAGYRLEGWDPRTGSGSPPRSPARTPTTNAARSTPSPPGRMRRRSLAECPPDALAEPHRTKRPRPTTPGTPRRSSRTSTHEQRSTPHEETDRVQRVSGRREKRFPRDRSRRQQERGRRLCAGQRRRCSHQPASVQGIDLHRLPTTSNLASGARQKLTLSPARLQPAAWIAERSAHHDST